MKAILYAAKSTEDVRGSIPTQLEEARELADREGWEVAGEYSDEARSAWSGDRGPGLASALEHAEREGATLIIQHSDRLARGDGLQAAHLVEYALMAMKRGFRIRSIDDPQTFADLLYAVVTGQRNHEDSQRKSEATKRGHARRRAQGKYHGGQRPYGLQLDGDGGYLPEPSEVEVLRRIYAEYLAGRSMLAITRGLNTDGIPNKWHRGKWHQGVVGSILRNEAYVKAGVLEREVWQQAQDLRVSRRNQEPRGRPPAGPHLFRKGMLRCGSCGASMVPRTARQGDRKYETYHCYGRALEIDSCDMAPQKREVIDTAVYNYFEQVGLDVDATRAAIAETLDRRSAELASLCAQADRERARAQAAVERVERDYLAGTLSSSSYERLVVRAADELKASQAEAERLAASEAEVARDSAMADAEQETVRQLTQLRQAIAGEIDRAESIDAVRAALQRLFDRFVLHVDIPRRAHVELIRPEVWIEPVVAEPGPDELRPGRRAAVPTIHRSSPQTGNCLPLEHAVFGPIPVGVA